MSSASMGELTGVLAERDCKNGNCNEEIETLPIFPVARISTVAVSPAMTGKLIRHRYHFSVRSFLAGWIRRKQRLPTDAIW